MAKGVESRVRRVIVEQLGVERQRVTLEADIFNDLGADSLDGVEILMALEDEFGIEMPDDEAEDLRTVRLIVCDIQKRVARKS